MHNLNPELLKLRMMRGALTGPAAEEISTMSRCKGKLENEQRCAVVAAPGKDLCTGCETRGAQLYDKTVKVPAVLRAHDLKPKKIMCGREGCGYGVKKEGDFCKKHQEPETGAGTVIHDVNNLETKPAVKTVTSDNVVQNAVHENMDNAHKTMCSDLEPLHFAADGVCLTACGVVSSSRTLLTENWDAVTCENCLVWKPADEKPAMTDAAFNEFTEMLYQSACGDDTESIIQAPGPGYQDGLQIQPVTLAPPPEQVAPSSTTRKGLAALLCSPPAPPAPPVGLHVPFSLDEIAILEEFEISVDHIRQFVVMGLEGQVCPLDTSDPLAKSRAHAAE